LGLRFNNRYIRYFTVSRRQRQHFFWRGELAAAPGDAGKQTGDIGCRRPVLARREQICHMTKSISKERLFYDW